MAVQIKFQVEEVLSQKLSQLSSQEKNDDEFEPEIDVGFEAVDENEDTEGGESCCVCGSKLNFCNF